MSTEPFTDEILSAIIDGEADHETVAAVASDPVASARLAQLRLAVAHVSAPVPDATPERRSASIAAAMAAATPAPEVSSLAAARHERSAKHAKAAPERRPWLALAAAAIALVVAIPLVLQLRGGGDSSETASDTSADDSVSLDATADAATDDAMEEAAAESGGADAMADSADMDQDAMAGSAEDDSAADAMDEVEAADDAADDEAADEPSVDTEAPEETESYLANAFVANSFDVLEESIDLEILEPSLTSDQAREAILEAGLSPDCVDSLGVVETPSLAIAILDEDGTEERLLLLSFDEDGNVTTLDAEDCAQLG